MGNFRSGWLYIFTYETIYVVFLVTNTWFTVIFSIIKLQKINYIVTFMSPRELLEDSVALLKC